MRTFANPHFTPQGWRAPVNRRTSSLTAPFWIASWRNFCGKSALGWLVAVFCKGVWHIFWGSPELRQTVSVGEQSGEHLCPFSVISRCPSLFQPFLDMSSLLSSVLLPRDIWITQSMEVAQIWTAFIFPLGQKDLLVCFRISVKNHNTENFSPQPWNGIIPPAVSALDRYGLKSKKGHSI